VLLYTSANICRLCCGSLEQDFYLNMMVWYLINKYYLLLFKIWYCFVMVYMLILCNSNVYYTIQSNDVFLIPTYLKNISKSYENESSMIGVMVWELDTSVVDCWFVPLVGSNQRLFKYNPFVNQTILKLKIKDSCSVLWLFDSDGCLWI
jgi:hypothetical protein